MHKLPDDAAMAELKVLLEELLQEPKWELLRVWSAPVPGLHAAVEEECRAAGTAEEVWAILGMPQPREGLELEFDDPPAEWEDVLRAWNYAFREEGREGGVANSSAALLPVFGPLTGPVSAEVLEEAFPKALINSRSELHLPLALWPAALEKLRREKLLNSVRGVPGVSEFHPALLWIARRELRADAALHEVVWRVFANVHGDLAGIAYADLLGSGHASGAVQARLLAQRGNFIAAFRYLVARHRPTRARPLLDLLKVVEAEAGDLLMATAGDLQTHVTRLYAWANCHPQGEFCPVQERVDLAKAWLELKSISPGYVPSGRHMQLVPSLSGDHNLALKAQLLHAHAANPGSASREDGLQTARLWHTAGETLRAVELALEAFCDGELVQPENQRTCLVAMAPHLLEIGRAWLAIRALLPVTHTVWTEWTTGERDLPEQAKIKMQLSALSRLVGPAFEVAAARGTAFKDFALLRSYYYWYWPGDCAVPPTHLTRTMLKSLLQTVDLTEEEVLQGAQILNDTTYPELALALMATRLLPTAPSGYRINRRWIKIAAGAASGCLLWARRTRIVPYADKKESILLCLKLLADGMCSNPRARHDGIIQGITLIAEARENGIALCRGDDAPTKGPGDELFLDFTAVLWGGGALERRTISESAAALGWETEPFLEMLRGRLEKLAEALKD